MRLIKAFVLSSLLIPTLTYAGDKEHTVSLKPTEKNTAEGTVNFFKIKEGVKVTGTIKNLTPGEHGLHIHEKGDCSATDAKSAGDHFNPSANLHGAPHDHNKHAGDFGNITANSGGIAKFEFVDKNLRMEGDNSIVNRSLVVHAKADDLKTQPAGDSGDRIACGVIG